jgi:hypothetical protein
LLPKNFLSAANSFDMGCSLLQQMREPNMSSPTHSQGWDSSREAVAGPSGLDIDLACLFLWQVSCHFILVGAKKCSRLKRPRVAIVTNACVSKDCGESGSMNRVEAAHELTKGRDALLSSEVDSHTSPTERVSFRVDILKTRRARSGSDG